MSYESQTMRKAIFTSLKHLWAGYDWVVYALLIGILFGSAL